MCKRYTITTLPSELEVRFPFSIPPDYKPRFNAAPTQYLPIVTNKNIQSIKMARWGFMGDFSRNKTVSKKLYNRTFDDFKTNKKWQQVILNNRCLILADGFYVWKNITKKTEVPYRVIPKNGKLICMAGIWEESESINSENITISFSLITRKAYKPVNELSERMPVILEQKKEIDWLNEDLDIESIIDVMEIEDWGLFKYYPVSPRINNIEIDKPDLIKPSTASDQHGNYTLFH